MKKGTALDYMTKGFGVEVIYLQEDEIVGTKRIHVNSETTDSIKNYLDRILEDLINSNSQICSVTLDKHTTSGTNQPYKKFLFARMRNFVRGFLHGKIAYEEISEATYTSTREMLNDVFSKINTEISEHYEKYHDYLNRNSLVKTK